MLMNRVEADEIDNDKYLNVSVYILIRHESKKV